MARTRKELLERFRAPLSDDPEYDPAVGVWETRRRCVLRLSGDQGIIETTRHPRSKRWGLWEPRTGRFLRVWYRNPETGKGTSTDSFSSNRHACEALRQLAEDSTVEEADPSFYEDWRK